MFEVVYYSMGGNTRKVAEVLAEELGTTAKNIKSVDTLPEDAFIFLGSGCYGAVLPKDISDFIERNHLKGKKIALFTTSAFAMKKEIEVMEKQIIDKGVQLTGHFDCFGQFVALRRGHPNQEDLEKAREFARSMIEQEYPQISGIEHFEGAAVTASQEARLVSL
jgi:flavodoxin